MSSNGGWIAVDLDGTLAFYDEWRGVEHIGAPIGPMVERVKKWLAEGKEVRIFTARVYSTFLAGADPAESLKVVTPIQAWCHEHLGRVLPITCVKDYGMIELWDDRAVQVVCNLGQPIDPTRVLHS